MTKVPLLILCTFILTSFSSLKYPSNEKLATEWAEAKLTNMSMDEMIGQLFMIRAHSNLGDDHISSVKNQIKKYHVGGLCFFQGTPTKQAELSNKYQALSKIPLLISIDGEWGLGMRFKENSISFPRQLTLGAIKNNDIIYDMGKEIAQHMKRIGIHINFAPVVDVNNNPANPVIHNRSFGEDIFNVSAKSFAYMKGMQDGGLIACAKHFPGHGDTDVDSHYDLPVINHSRKRIDSLELMPFKSIFQAGIKSVMSAHLQIPSLDNRPNRPASLSKNILTDILKNELKFEGIVFTDAMEMKGVAKHFTPAQAAVEALLAGNDVILLPADMDQAFKGVQSAIAKGEIDSTMIANKAKKILYHKYLVGLDKSPRVENLNTISQDINNKAAIVLKTKLYEEAITLVKNESLELPIVDLNNKKIAVISLGTETVTPFQKRLASYANIEKITAGNTISEAQQTNIKNKLASYDHIIISLHDLSIRESKKFGLSQSQLDLIFLLNSQNKITLVNFGSPYLLKYFENIPNLVQAYEEDDICQDVTAQTIMGANAFRGFLPVSIGTKFPYRHSIIKPSLGRLAYGLPESVGMSSDTLMQIEEIVEEMIKERAAPGCQILAIKDGQVVYDKAFGYHTYNKKKKVQVDHIYDVASITKILATTISLMRLDDIGTISLDQRVDQYLPEIDTCNKGNLILYDMLAHHASLPGWIPFYKATIEEEKKKSIPSEKYYRETLSDSFCLEVVKDMYLRCDYQDSIYSRIYACGLEDNNNYKYSDLGFYLFHQIVHRMSGRRLDYYANENFYESLGLRKTGFNPLLKHPKEIIAPSEDDNYFRNTVVQGNVHDMGSAMLGGVSGHAGLFSTAGELGIIMQMLMNGGTYGGRQYLDSETIRKFTTRHHRSTRRGMGFDMKELNPDKTLNMSELASSSTFGHLGFTGCAIFADPETNLIYVFLSNRTYPTMNNSKFSKNEYRPRVQSVFYKALQQNVL